MRRIALCLLMLASLSGCMSRETFVAEAELACRQKSLAAMAATGYDQRMADRLAAGECTAVAEQYYLTYLANREVAWAEGAGFVAGALLGAAATAYAPRPVYVTPVVVVPARRGWR